MHLTKSLPVMFAFVLVVAACGGGTTPSTAGAPSAPAATPAVTGDGGGVEATATPAVEGGGSGIDDFCLNTVEEVSAAFKVEVGEATSSENPGLGGACLYTDVDGAQVFGLSVITAAGAVATFDASAGAEGSEAVSGIGDAALYVPLDKYFGILFRKGDAVVNIGPSGTDAFDLLGGDNARLRAATEGLARTAADRL